MFRTLVAMAVGMAFTTCATAGQKSAAALQRDLPQVLATCNALDGPAGNAFRSDIRYKACKRLAVNGMIGLASPQSQLDWKFAQRGFFWSGGGGG